MILKIFTVYDSKAEAYLKPFFLRSTGEAIRAFEENCNDINANFFKYPSDYTLFEIGSYNDNTTEIVTLTAIKSLGLAHEYKRQQPLPLDDPQAPFALPVNPNGEPKPNG